MNQECVNCKLNRQCFSINNISNTKVCLKESTRYETYTMTPEEEIKWLRQCVRDLQEKNRKYKSAIEKLQNKFNFYKNTEWGQRSCEILKPFEDILKEVE